MKLLVLAAWMAWAQLDPELVGTWKYVAYQYQGQIQPLPSPGLDLRFTFDGQGNAHLKWFYEGEQGFCERVARYEIQKPQWLYQKVAYVNPQNHVSCSKDSDMRMDKETLTHYRIENGKLLLDLDLSGQSFTYILEPR